MSESEFLALAESTLTAIEAALDRLNDADLLDVECSRSGNVLDIEFIDSAEAPVGLGEPGTTVVAPAIGNAIYAAVGARLRHLPIRPAAVRDALTRRS